MPRQWTDKQERKYEHIVESEKDQGEPTRRAKEIAARTVNKERAASGETRGSGRTKEQLYNQAKRLNVPGRSQMTKAQLQRAVDARK